jgi:hypothetical protein
MATGAVRALMPSATQTDQGKSMNASTQRYRAADLVAFARGLFAAAGCDGDKPWLIAEMLVEPI